MEKPACYATANNLQRSGTRDFSEEFVHEFRRMSGRCLDVGSGPGDAVVDYILPKLNTKASLVCSDISEKMVDFGKERYKDNERLSFLKLNINSSDLPKHLIERFDHVTSFYCLHWCQDMRQTFENIFNLLRPGGTALLTFVANSPLFESYTALASLPHYKSYMKDVDRYIPVFQHVEKRRESLEALLLVIGFEIHHCSVKERTHIHDSPDDLGKFLLALNPFIERMPSALKENYRKDLLEEVVKRNVICNRSNNNEDDYSILYTHHTFVVHLGRPSDIESDDIITHSLSLSATV